MKEQETFEKRYGYRGRIGFIAPGSTIETIPVEFYKVAPPGITIVFVSIGIKRLTKEDIEESLKGIEQAAAELARTKTDVIILGGSPPVIVGGFGFDKKIIARIGSVTGTPATTSQTLAVEALTVLGVKKLVIASPFGENQNVLLRKFMQDSGFLVHAIKGLNMERIEYGMLPRTPPTKLHWRPARGSPITTGSIFPAPRCPPLKSLISSKRNLGNRWSPASRP